MIKSESAMLRGLQLAGIIKLKTLYPAGTPDAVHERLEREWQRMRECGQTEDFYVFQALAEAARRTGSPFNLRGPGNASLLVFLLHDSAVDPMPAYYYCKNCGYYEEIPDVLFGLDAEDRPCPRCGTVMTGQGFSLPEEFAWRDGKGVDLFEITARMPAASILSELKRHYGNRAAKLAEYAADGQGRPVCTLEDCVRRFVIFPEGKTVKDYPDLAVRCGREKAVCAPPEELDRLGTRRWTFVRWMNYPLGGHANMSLRGVMPMPELMEKLRGRVGIPDLLPHGEVLSWGGNATRMRRAWQRMQEETPESFYELTEAVCYSHSTWRLPYPADDGPVFSSREGLYHLLVRNGIPGPDAFRIAEFVRKGRAANPARREEWQKYLDAFPIPETVRADAENCRYLWSQAVVLPAVTDAIASAGRRKI